MVTGLELEKTSNLHTGLGVFCYHLADSLLKTQHEDIQFRAYLPLARKELFGNSVPVLQQEFWHRWAFPRSYHTDLWHCLHQDSAYYPKRGVPLMLTIHDLNFMYKYRGWRREYRKRKLGKMLDRSSELVCISQSTGKHLQEVYGLGSDDYKVIYNGTFLKSFPGITASRFQRQNPFLLCLGVLSPRKNAHVLAGMMAQIPDFDLILAGPVQKAYAEKVKEEARRFGVSNRIVITGTVSEEEKYRLLQNMQALLFPSLAEGFGLPVTEAMSIGKPVFLSRYGSLPEIGGDAAFYWNNFEPEHMASVVLEGLTKSAEGSYPELLSKRASLFSWEEAAAQYIRLYRRLL